ncbi:putative FMN-binding regulatory protein PaiB [Bradyrhizobium sp. USDA 4503]|uniref:hypothetical protein n=1 Tax=Bradyrhizobium brasilense TaxID=1419277 RepID=UPI003B9699F3
MRREANVLSIIDGLQVAFWAAISKMSQNRVEADRIGVVAGLAASEKPEDRNVARHIPIRT